MVPTPDMAPFLPRVIPSTSGRAPHLGEEPTDLWHSRLADGSRKSPFHNWLAVLLSENKQGHCPPVATAGGVLIISDSNCCSLGALTSLTRVSASAYHRRVSSAKSSFPTRVNTASSKASWDTVGETPTCWQRTSFCRVTDQIGPN